MADQSNALRVAEILAARLCHDLSGPIGGLNHALALLADDLPADHEALVLAREAGEDLARRLRLRRAAWGQGGPALDLPALRAIAEEPRTELDVTGLPPATEFAPPMARTLLNLILVAREGLRRGGRIALSGMADDVFIAIDGPGAAWPRVLYQCLSDETAAMTAIDDARTLQTPLTWLLVRGQGLRLSMLLGPGPGAPPLRLSSR